MNESMDRVVADWLHEGPERGPRDGLERALAATRRVGQRPGWTLPERWLPVQLTMTRTRSQRPIFAIVALALLILAMVATALYIGSQRPLPTPPFRNGAIAVGKDGDIFVADRPGGDLRPLVAGPEDDRSPMFSPDGTRLAFYRETGRGTFLMIADADGTNVVQIPGEPPDSGGASRRTADRSSASPSSTAQSASSSARSTRPRPHRPGHPAAVLLARDRGPGSARQPPGDPRRGGAGRSARAVRVRPCDGGIRTIVEPADGQYVQTSRGSRAGSTSRTGSALTHASSRRTDQVTKSSTPCVVRSARCPTTAPGSSPIATSSKWARRTLIPGTTPISMRSSSRSMGKGSPSSWPAALGWRSSAHGPGSRSPDDSMLLGTVPSRDIEHLCPGGPRHRPGNRAGMGRGRCGDSGMAAPRALIGRSFARREARYGSPGFDVTLARAGGEPRSRGATGTPRHTGRGSPRSGADSRSRDTARVFQPPAPASRPRRRPGSGAAVVLEDRPVDPPGLVL